MCKPLRPEENILYGQAGRHPRTRMIVPARRAEAHHGLHIDLEDHMGRVGYDAHLGSGASSSPGGGTAPAHRAWHVRFSRTRRCSFSYEATSVLDSEVEAGDIRPRRDCDGGPKMGTISPPHTPKNISSRPGLGPSRQPAARRWPQMEPKRRRENEG